MRTSDLRDRIGLSQKAAAGVAWSTIATAGKQVLSVASLATVARVLGPGPYGVMGMANLVIVFIANFRDLGTGTAIIQRPSVSNRLLSSLFWVNCLLGLLLAGAIAAASPLTARFFRAPQLVAILSVLSMSLWLSSSAVVHSSLLMRSMRFRTLAIADLSSGGIAYAVALVCAYSGFGVWSLVYANLANTLSSTMMYWIACRWRPAAEFDRADIKAVTRFSLNLSGFGLVNYFSRNADNIVVGKVLGPTSLGNYQLAYNLMLTPLQSISSVIAQVTLPAFAQIQHDDERFRSAYLRSSSIVSLVTFPLMAGLGVVADPFIRAVLGMKWLGAIPIFQVLAPVGLLQSVQTLVGSIYMAKGRTDWMFRWGVYYCAVVVLAFISGVRFGALGVAVAYCFAYFTVLAYPGFSIPFRLIGLKMRDFAGVLLPQILLTAGMAIICWIWLHILMLNSISNVWTRLLSTSLIGIMVYTVGLFVTRPPAIGYLGAILSNSQSATAAKAGLIIQRFGRA
jgi:PST family polysaccharide transporter